jgi:CRISPR-associated endonuclease/helicase Cas3
VLHGEAEVIFNKAATGDGKSLAAYLPGLLNSHFRIMGLYPTNALVEDQDRQHKQNYKDFRLQERTHLSVEDWIEKIYGAELARKVQKVSGSNKFQELLFSIEHTPVLLSNPDIFHLITHFQYLDITCDPYILVGALAQNIDLFVFDEFPVFDAHQEAAALNSMLLIRATQQRQRRFLFTSATPKEEFIGTLQKARFSVKEIGGDEYYANKWQPGFRSDPILQSVKLKFVSLQNPDPLTWLIESVDDIQDILRTVVKTKQQKEIRGQGRGLIILNSVALAGRVVRELKKVFKSDDPNGIAVEEISGRIGSQERDRTLEKLRHEKRPVLVVGTSAVDVGVDFDIHLLIFEASDSATFIQRLGRLGRHKGFSEYKAYALIAKRTPWIWSRLEKALKPEQEIDRRDFREIVRDIFDSPTEFWQYRHRWGAVQAQGMLHQMSIGSDGKQNKERQGVMQSIQERMKVSLHPVYGNALEAMEWYWKPSKDRVREEVQEQLLRFRGGSTLQAAVWDSSNFYKYDLLKLLPNALVEVVERDEFLEEAKKFGYVEEEFPERHIHVYLKLQDWLDKWQEIALRRQQKSAIKHSTLSIITGLSLISQHPQTSSINRNLSQRKLLAFLVPITSKPNDHWRIHEMLHLNPTFGLYRLTDLDGDTYACAFNQDALLLDALAQSGKFRKYCQAQSESLFF